MAELVKVARTADVPRGQGRMFEVNGRQIALFNCEGTFYAIDNRCEHQGGPLAEGDLDGQIVTCPWHGWTYDVATGQSPDDADTCVERFEVRVEGEDVLVGV
jgi:nitrite reductase (NADH) small subunit